MRIPRDTQIGILVSCLALAVVLGVVPIGLAVILWRWLTCACS